MLGAPSGARASSYGVQSCLESRTSSLMTPPNFLSLIGSASLKGDVSDGDNGDAFCVRSARRGGAQVVVDVCPASPSVNSLFLSINVTSDSLQTNQGFKTPAGEAWGLLARLHGDETLALEQELH